MNSHLYFFNVCFFNHQRKYAKNKSFMLLHCIQNEINDFTFWNKCDSVKITDQKLIFFCFDWSYRNEFIFFGIIICLILQLMGNISYKNPEHWSTRSSLSCAKFQIPTLKHSPCQKLTKFYAILVKCISCLTRAWR